MSSKKWIHPGRFKAASGHHGGGNGGGKPLFSVTDNFNRGNSGSLGANWTTIPGMAVISVASNQANGNTPSSAGAVWTGDSFTNNQSAQVVLKAPPSANFNYGLVICRQAAPGESSYQGGFATDLGDNIYRILKYVNYTRSILAVHASQTAADGDVVKIKAVGTTITLTVNGVDILSVVDATYASGTLGLQLSGTNSPVDNFVASNE